MAVLSDILYKVNLIEVSGNMNREIRRLCFDSREIEDGALFVAIRGTKVDGHEYILKAIDKGAVAILCENLPEELSDEVTYVKVENSARALGIASANFYQNPSREIKVIGITGTNGKTTTATLLYQLIRALGHNAGLLSTVENKINDKVTVATHTTPDALTINRLLREMVDKKCSYCIMEVSSHAIHQNRIHGIRFEGAVFMNITHDHLDYHKTFEEYIKTKKALFDNLSADAFALVNTDDKRAKIMVQNTAAKKYSFALRTMADFKAKILSNTIQGLELKIGDSQVWFKLVGDFNAYNLLAVYASAVLLGEEEQEILTHLSKLEGAPGRFEKVMEGFGNVIAIVDYAHTPDALKNILKTIKNAREGGEKLITVVGCGGDRDKGKRPLMADIACKNSDKVILTSDNPRNEDPESILEDMQKGINPVHRKKTLIISNRKEAIKAACTLAGEHDIILVAGKGHESYQEIKGVRHPFDDRKVLKEMLALTKN